MFWINLSIILVCLFRVGERAFHKKTQFIYGLIQLVGMLLALIQGVSWLYYQHFNSSPK